MTAPTEATRPVRPVRRRAAWLAGWGALAVAAVVAALSIGLGTGGKPKNPVKLLGHSGVFTETMP